MKSLLWGESRHFVLPAGICNFHCLKPTFYKLHVDIDYAKPSNFIMQEIWDTVVVLLEVFGNKKTYLLWIYGSYRPMDLDSRCAWISYWKHTKDMFLLTCWSKWQIFNSLYLPLLLQFLTKQETRFSPKHREFFTLSSLFIFPNLDKVLGMEKKKKKRFPLSLNQEHGQEWGKRSKIPSDMTKRWQKKNEVEERHGEDEEEIQYGVVELGMAMDRIWIGYCTTHLQTQI